MKTFTRNTRSEVDIQVAQELKNHNELMYNTGQSIVSLRDKLDALYTEREKVLNKSESDVKKVLIAFENFRDEMLSKFKELSKRIDQVEQISNASSLRVNKLSLKVHTEYPTEEEQEKTSNVVNNKIAKLEATYLTQKEYIEQRFRQLHGNFMSSLEVLREDLSPVIPKIDPVQKKIDESISAVKVDQQGLVQEIERLKKTLAYDQKKFENIYTLIERLKERKE